jgi:2-keto-4-pentenoate hydratase
MTDPTILSRRLAQARSDHIVIETLPADLAPTDANAAYSIQHEILALRGARVGGWKVGAKSPTGPIQGAPLPAGDLCASGARLPRRGFTPLGLELEIAFRFSRAFEPRSEPYSDEEVHAAIASMAAAIEIVASRYAAWPEVDKLAQLADLQNHGALVASEWAPYREDFPFVAPVLRFDFEGTDIVKELPANPAGDPRRLLPWLVNHCTQRHGITLTPDMIVTTGSYTGMYFPTTAGTASGRIEGLAPVDLTLF